MVVVAAVSSLCVQDLSVRNGSAAVCHQHSLLLAPCVPRHMPVEPEGE